ncbi:MAG: AAA family ATPase [Pseudomonadota bacterium]
MKIDAFRFRHVGPFGADGIKVENIQPGLNVIAEHNERGKSSLLAALETVLFLPHTSWRGDAKRLKREDGTPVGQIDFTHYGQSYRLDKQFLSGKTAQLTNLSTGAVIAKKREAEEKLADMLGLHRDDKGPSGLLWVRQGDSMMAAEDDGQVASRLESELSTLVGGDRARAYLERAEAELSELLTATGRIKANGPLALAEDAFASLEAELETARQAQRDTRQSGQDLARIQAQIADLESDYDPKQEAKALEDARHALSQAQVADSQLAQKRAHLGRLKVESEQAQIRLTTYQSHVANLDKALADAERLRQEIAVFKDNKAGAQQALTNAAQALADLDDQHKALLQLDALKAVQDQLSVKNAALQSLNENLEQLEADISQRNALIEERDALPSISREQLDTLDRIAREQDQVEAEYRGIDARLLLTLQPGVTAKIGDESIPSGPVQIDATQTLEIEGAGHIRLDPADLRELDARQTDLNARLTALLTEMAVEDQQTALDAFRAREQLSTEISLINRQMAISAPQGHEALLNAKERLSQDIARLTDRIEQQPDIDMEHFDPHALARNLAKASGEKQAAQDTLNQIDRSLIQLEEKLGTQNRIIEQAEDTVRPDQRDAVSAKLIAAAATLAEQVRQAEDSLKSAEAQNQTDPEMLNARIQRLTDAARNRTQKLTDLRQEEAALIATRKASFEQRDPDAEVDRLEARQVTLAEEVRRHRRRANALTLLRDTLREAQSSLQARYTDPVKQELLPLLRMVIEDADIDLNENLGAEGLLRHGQTEEIARLSGGTREQIAILTRLAFARMLSRQGYPSPVILDDALVYADDQRRQRMFEVMNYVTRGSDPLQLLYLSCHERSTRELGGHVLNLQPWPESSSV